MQKATELSPGRNLLHGPGSGLHVSQPQRPTSAFRARHYGPIRPEKSTVFIADPERVKDRIRELSESGEGEEMDTSIMDTPAVQTQMRIRPHTAPWSRGLTSRAKLATEPTITSSSGLSDTSLKPASVTALTPLEATPLPIPAPPTSVFSNEVGSPPVLRDVSRLQRPDSASARLKHAAVPGNPNRILSASQYVKSVSSLLNPPLRPVPSTSQLQLNATLPNDLNASGPAEPRLSASHVSNETTSTLVETASRVSQQNLEQAALRVWWLEQNCRILQDDAQRQSKLAKNAADNAQRLETATTQVQRLTDENATLRRALAELHASRVTQTEQLRDSLLKATNAQKRLIVEKNAELGQQIQRLELEVSRRDALLEERAAALRIADEERTSARALIERQTGELTDLNNRLRRWEQLCTQEQSNANSAWEVVRKRETELEELRTTIDNLRRDLETTRSALAASQAREDTTRERMEDADRVAKDLRLQLDREKDTLALERSALSAKTAELEASLRLQAQLTDQADTASRQLQRCKDEIEVLKLRTAGSDRSFEVHRVQMAQLETQVHELKEALQRRDEESQKSSVRIADLLRVQAIRESELNNAVTMHDSMKQRTETLQRNVEKLETDLSSARTRASVLEEEVRMSAIRCERVMAEKIRIEEMLRESEAARNNLEATAKDHASKLRESMSARSSLEMQLQSQGAELRGLTKQFIQLQGETLELRSLVHAKTESLASAKTDRDRVEKMLQSQISLLDQRQAELQTEVREAREELARIQGLREAERVAAENELRLWKRQLARRRDVPPAAPGTMTPTNVQTDSGRVPLTPQPEPETPSPSK